VIIFKVLSFYLYFSLTSSLEAFQIFQGSSKKSKESYYLDTKSRRCIDAGNQQIAFWGIVKAIQRAIGIS